MTHDEIEQDALIHKLNARDDVASLYTRDLDATDLSPAGRLLFREHKPGNSLIIYGSLAPGKSNHTEVEHISGSWYPAHIRGQLENKGWGAGSGFPAFRHALPEESELIPAWVLISGSLPLHWQALDEFEGVEYRRILAEYELENGQKGIGYVYALNE